MSSQPTPNFSTRPPAAEGHSRTIWIVLGVAFVALALPLSWSCGKAVYHNYRLATAAVDHFHRQLDRGDYDAIYGEATDEFRRAGSREDSVKFFEMVHEKMGNSGTLSAKGFHINMNNGRLFVNQVYSTQFSQGEAQEAFVWRVDGEQPRLLSYHIDSPNLASAKPQ